MSTDSAGVEVGQ